MGQLPSSTVPASVSNIYFELFGLQTLQFIKYIHEGDVEQLRVLLTALNADEMWSLLHMQFPPFAEVRDRRTGLVIAIIKGHAELVALLLEKGADPQETYLFTASLDFPEIYVLPLWLAVTKRQVEVCRQLLAFGAYVDGGTDSGETPLHIASYMDCLDIVTLLVENGANVGLQNSEGYAAMMLAAAARRVDVVRYLLSNGASVDQTNFAGDDFSLLMAVKAGSLELCQLLLESDADVNQAASNGFTSLMCACYLGHTSIVTFLVENGANIEHATVRGNINAVNIGRHYALERRNLAVFVVDGTRIGDEVTYGNTALMYAAKKGRVDTVRFLLSKGARTDRTNSAGKTAMSWAIDHRKTEIVEILHAAAEQRGPNE
uniref:ANK_REP_REGION domain-containing protein n=1 Tax=Globodera pallida TaxID=36090 RepID=A0A183CCQ9_GLOPA